MTSSSARLRAYLAPEETVEASVTVAEAIDPPIVGGTLGMTDRRLLLITPDGEMVSLRRDAICSIRSRPHVTRTYRGRDHRLLAAAGGLISVLALAGLLALPTPPATVAFVALVLGSLTVLGYLSWPVRASLNDMDSIVAIRALLGVIRDRPDAPLIAASVSGTLVGLAGLIIVAARPAVIVAVGALIGGAGLFAYAYANRDEYSGIEIVRHEARDVTVSTPDGTSIAVRCTPGDDLDRIVCRDLFSVGEHEVGVPTATEAQHASEGQANPAR